MRRAILIGYLLAVTFAFTWVPWQRRFSPDLTEFAGYGWIWAGPDLRDDEAPQASKETSQATSATPVAQSQSEPCIDISAGFKVPSAISDARKEYARCLEQERLKSRSAAEDWVDKVLEETERDQREEAIRLKQAERKAREETIRREQKLAAIDRERLAVELVGLSAVFGVLFLVASALRVREPESSMVKSAESGPVQQICEARSSETVSVGRISEEPQVTTSQAKGQESVGQHDTTLPKIGEELRGDETSALWLQSGIFIGGAILTSLLAGYAFNLSYDAVRLVTKALLQLSVAAIALNWALGPRWRRWLTIKRTCIAALLVYGGTLIWIFTTIYSRGSTSH